MTLSVPDATKLGYAITVAREGSYGAAAAKLNMSQPALSRSIQALEAEYGIRLFERGRGGARPTNAGAGFLNVAEKLVQRAERGEDELRRVASGRHKPVSFGLGPITAGVALPSVLADLIAGGAQFRVRIGSVSSLQLLLHQGDIEFYVSGVPANGDRGGKSSEYRIRRIPFSGLSLLVRERHPLLKRAFDATALSAYPVAAGSFLYEVLPPARLAQLGLQSPSVELDDYAELANLARQTDLILVATSLLALARPELKLRALPLSVPVDELEWALVSSQRDELSRAAQQIADLLFQRLVKFAREHTGS